MDQKQLEQAVEKRRTFAIISHPDAGKTTITEQLLLFGGVVRSAGTVKAKKTGNFAKSDWMEIEKKRGIFGRYLSNVDGSRLCSYGD